jgi:peptidyl-dipeptidase Dcp
VSDSDGGRHVGLFYLDNFARVGKKSGAWQDNYRDQQHLDASVTPLASINNNFVKGAPGEPVFISLDDVRTLYHEFGHALHALLQDIRYPGLGDASHDYVEYPSQVNENWVLTREVLDRFACHHRTGEPMPSELVEKVERARKFNQGYKTVEYLSDAMLDMELHVVPRDHVDVSAFERDELARIGMPYEVALRHRLTHFDHLFGSDSYSAGYYSYLWADVMAADTWKAFLEAGGPWDKLLARRFRAYVLAPGNASDRAEAYRSFRGADPDPRALFEARGLSEDHRDRTN